MSPQAAALTAAASTAAILLGQIVLAAHWAGTVTSDLRQIRDRVTAIESRLTAPAAGPGPPQHRSTPP